MNGRERVKAAMHYMRVDKAPLQYYCTPVGFYEHGEKLNDLYESVQGDFEPFVRRPIAGPAAGDYDPDGTYHAFRTDEWGTVWEYRIFGITGIPRKYPITGYADSDAYTLPKLSPLNTTEKAELAAKTARHKEKYYALMHAGSLLERIKQIMPDDETFCGIELDEPEMNRLADRICDYDSQLIARAVEAGADGIAFGDDYGAERTMLFSPATWRRFFKPRLLSLFKPAVKAGLDVHFHSCGMIAPILEDLRAIGVTSIWPQLPAYDMKTLADTCRSLGLAIAIHTDRANTMTFGTPQEVRDLVLREFETFKMMDGGSWFYVEADNDFPFENIEALVKTIAQWR